MHSTAHITAVLLAFATAVVSSPVELRKPRDCLKITKRSWLTFALIQNDAPPLRLSKCLSRLYTESTGRNKS